MSKPSEKPAAFGKTKASHPWRAWNPGQFKRQAAPTPHRELHEITKPNRAR